MTATYKPRTKTSEETNPADALISDFQRTSRNSEERNLGHPQQPNMPFSEANRQEMKNFCLAATFSSVQFSSILKEMGIPDHLTCLLRNLYAGQEKTVRTGHGTTDWFQIGKGVRQGCILSPCLFNLYTEYIMRTLGWRQHARPPCLSPFLESTQTHIH